MPTVDWDDVPDADDYSPIPAGQYLCRVARVDDSQTTQHGDEMWNIELEVVEGEHKGRKVFDRISFGQKALPRAKLVCSRLGLDTTGRRRVAADDIAGRTVLASVLVEEFLRPEGGRQKRNVVPFAGYERVAVAVGAAVQDEEDDLPF